MTKEKLLWFSSLGLGFLLAACGGGEQETAETAEYEAGAPAGDVEPVDPTTVGAITGTISFEGDAPRMPRIRMDAVPACMEVNPDPVYSEEVIVNDNGTLRNVFIYVKDGLGERRFPIPDEAVVINQIGCSYQPHVVGLMAGQTLRLKNNDSTNHNVHPLPTSNREWNQSQPPGSADLEEQFARPEIMIPVKCNVHPWMKAYIGVQRHPFFAASGDNGTFSIEGLPPGTYTIEAWHEKYEAQEMQVTVGESETATADFSFSEG